MLRLFFFSPVILAVTLLLCFGIYQNRGFYIFVVGSRQVQGPFRDPHCNNCRWLSITTCLRDLTKVSTPPPRVLLIVIKRMTRKKNIFGSIYTMLWLLPFLWRHYHIIMSLIFEFRILILLSFFFLHLIELFNIYFWSLISKYLTTFIRHG